MKIEFLSEPDVNAECISLLNRHFSTAREMPSSVLAVMDDICARYEIPTAPLADERGILSAVEVHVLEGLDFSESQLKFFFSTGKYSEAALAWALYFFEQEEIDLAAQSEWELVARLRHLLCITLDCEPDEVSQLSDSRSLCLFLKEYPCSLETKWACTLFWSQPVEYQQLYREIMASAAELYTQMLPALKPLYAAGEADMRKMFLSVDPIKSLSQVGLHTDYEGGVLYARPHAMLFNGMAVVWDNYVGNDSAQLFAGVLYQRIKELAQLYSTSDETLANGLRAIGDKRRIAILKELRKRPLCGRELADILGIAPTTVSYHMNFLVDEGFVTVEKSGNRVTYSTCAEHADHFTRSLCNAIT